MHHAIASRRLRVAAAAAGLLLVAAAPGLLGYAPDLLESETCLAPDFAGADCTQFRRLMRPGPYASGFEEEPRIDDFKLPLDVAALLLTSNELAGGGARPTARVGSRARTAEIPCATSRHRPDRASCPRRGARRR
jgi:hypothetical protein